MKHRVESFGGLDFLDQNNEHLADVVREFLVDHFKKQGFRAVNKNQILFDGDDDDQDPFIVYQSMIPTSIFPPKVKVGGKFYISGNIHIPKIDDLYEPPSQWENNAAVIGYYDTFHLGKEYIDTGGLIQMEMFFNDDYSKIKQHNSKYM